MGGRRQGASRQERSPCAAQGGPSPRSPSPTRSRCACSRFPLPPGQGVGPSLMAAVHETANDRGLRGRRAVGHRAPTSLPQAFYARSATSACPSATGNLCRRSRCRSGVACAQLGALSRSSHPASSTACGGLAVVRCPAAGRSGGAAASPTRTRTARDPLDRFVGRSPAAARRAATRCWVSQACGVVPVSLSNRRANVRGDMCARAARSSTETSSSQVSAPSSRATVPAFHVGARNGSLDELRLPALTVGRHDHPTGDPVRHRRTELLPHQVQAGVDPRRRARAGDDRTVVDVQHVGHNFERAGNGAGARQRGTSEWCTGGRRAARPPERERPAADAQHRGPPRQRSRRTS